MYTPSALGDNPVLFALFWTASVQMVSSPGVSPPSVSTPAGSMASTEAVYIEALTKMEAECLADLEKAFDETAKTAKAESDKIWGELNAEFADDDSA